MLSTKTLKRATGLLLGASFAPLAFAGGGYGAPAYTPDLLPSNPNAGMCYARVEIPAQFTTTQEDVLVEEGYTTIEVSQAQLATRQERIMTKEASVRYEVRQPTFRSVTERIMTRPAYDKLTVTAPRFNTVNETMASSAPRLVWKKGNPGALMAQGYTIHSTADGGQNGRGYSSTVQYGQTGGATNCGSTCEIWCLVEEPGESVSFRRKVVASPARVQRRTVPARFQNVTKQVVADPGGVREIPVAAQFRSVTVEEIVSPGGERQVTVPPKYGKVAKKQLVSAERYEWRQVVCATGTAPVARTMTPRVTTVTPTHITSAPSYNTGSSYTTGSSYGMAPTVNQMLSSGSRAVCIEGKDCTDVLRSQSTTGYTSGSSYGGSSYGGSTYSSGSTNHGAGNYSHSGGHSQGSHGNVNAYESGRYGN